MTFTPIPPCMGGWCALRDSCARHHQRTPHTPAERLCTPGQANAYRPLQPPPVERIIHATP